MDLVATLRTIHRHVSRDAVAFYAVTWIAYVFAACAVAAPVAAATLRRRAGVRADASSARRDAVLSVLNDVPFVALLYIWLFLAAMAPVNVIAAESCYDWAATVARASRRRARVLVLLRRRRRRRRRRARDSKRWASAPSRTSGARTTRR